MNYVWYASYGSNVNQTRFHSYILGTRYKDNLIKEFGCKDNTLPIESRSYVFDRGIVFNYNSKKWGSGGVAFLDKQKSNQITYGKIYKITEEQFKDIVMQENKLNPFNDNITIDYELLDKNKEYKLNDSWYGLIINVDTVDNCPVYTFTSPKIIGSYNSPSSLYLKTIINGIKSTHTISNNKLLKTFKEYKGISKSVDCLNRLERLINL